MTIQIERNENGNCINFKGATQPVYWNNCLTAVAVGTDRIDIRNDIRSAGTGQTYYEYFNVKIEDFCDNTGTVFTSASDAVNYINGVAQAVPSGGGVGIGTTGSVNTSGIITATSFFGDGSGLTGIVASGSGVVVQNGGSNVGTASTINFGSDLDATFSGGVATINVSIPLSALTDVNTSNLSGISTDYLMVYDPTIPGFKFVNPKTYFGINNDSNPAPDIVDYGTY